jgi:hypothetical protein
VRSVLDENPDFLAAHYKLWYIYAAMGDRVHANPEFQWVVQGIADPTHATKILNLLRDQGYIAAVREFGLGDDPDYYGSKVDGARCLASAGDNAAALNLLESAYRDHEGWMIYVQADPAFAALHGDPRFQQLVDEVRKKS